MYYPKSQIIENQKTNGGELQNSSTQQDYKGAYYQTSDGSFYSGKNPQDRPSFPLTPISQNDNPITNPTNITPPDTVSRKFVDPTSEPTSNNYFIIDENYYSSKNIPEDRGEAPRKPKFTLNTPSLIDYQNGYFTRYFVKKVNNNLYLEVNKKEYNLFKKTDPTVQFNLYIPIEITWNLTGNKIEVFNKNKTIVSLKEQKENLSGFTLSFKNKFDKYYKTVGD
jgi:hypothetical protein